MSETTAVNPMLAMIVATVTESTKNANAIAEEIVNASKDKNARTHEVIADESVTDEKVVQYREWENKLLQTLEEGRSQISEYIASQPALIGATLSEEDLTTKKTEYGKLKESVTSGVKFAKSGAIPGLTDEEITAAFKDVPELKTLRGGSSGATGEGGKKPRLERVSYSLDNGKTYSEVWENVKNAKTGKEEAKVSFTILAKKLATELKAKVEVKDLQSAVFDAAKTDDLSTTNGRVIELVHTVGEKNVFLRVQAKDPNAAKAEDEAEKSEPESEEKSA